MKQPNLTIVLTGGGSGGHITPLLSLAHELKAARPGARLAYIGLKGDRLDGLKADYRVFDDVYYVPSGKFRRYHGESFLAHLVDLKTLLLNARDFFRVIRGIAVSHKILKKVKPTVIFSKGGFVSVPVGIAAHWRRIPIVTHDSDTVPGLANRIIGRWASIHATGMPAEHYSYPNESTRYTGIPIDEHFKVVGEAEQTKSKIELGLPAESLVLLIGGAGLGARDVNNKVIETMPQLLSQFASLRILHIAGQQLADQVKEDYKHKLGEQAMARVSVISFTPDFYKYSGAADLVITRAGATTIAELAVQRKAVILIPAPFLTGGHQLRNAEALNKEGAAEMLPNDASPQRLLEAISELLGNPAKRAGLAAKLALSAKPQAAKELAEIILEVAERGTGG